MRVEAISTVNNPSRVYLLGAWVDPVNQQQAIEKILSWCEGRQRQYVVTPNLDHCRMLRRNKALAAAYENAGMAIADGWPLVAASYLTALPLRRRVTGTDIIEPLCRACAASGYSVFLLGTTEDALAAASARLRETIPGLAIGTYSPPFGFDSDPAEVEKVNAAIMQARPHVVFVALGSPKQEVWMNAHVAHLPIGAALGVGAGVDFIARKQRRAPLLVRWIAMEWAWRAATEPRRLFKRYAACVAAFPGLLILHLRQHMVRRAGVRHLEP